mmetsp:Transcript_33997/g.73317  ORF Transcript_33997/g.73317 Transcript_33997/m.73317 type:complete len:576 (+) Transcript_33997:1-1728(+)
MVTNKELMSDLGIDNQRLITACDKAGYYQVSERLYTKQGNYAKVMQCYVQDPKRRARVFTFLETALRDPDTKAQVREDLLTATLKHISTLVVFDAMATAKLVIQHLGDESSRIIKELESVPETQYLYLKALIAADEKRKIGETGEDKTTKIITMEVQETYIKLLCLYQKDEVYNFLCSHDEYTLELCLELCKQHGLSDAVAYLLERMGDVGGALNLFIETLDRRLIELNAAFEKDGDEDGDKLAIDNVGEALALAVNLCRRNSGRLDEKESEQLWFRLLDKFVEPQRTLKKQQKAMRDTESTPPTVAKTQSALAGFINDVLYSMMGYVAFPSILGKIVHDHGSDEFGDFRSSIMGMLETYNYEMNILTTANHLLADDTYRSMRVFHRRRSKALVPKEVTCVMCTMPLQKSALDEKLSAVSLFQCGHVFHADCLGKNRNCPLCRRNDASSRKAMAKARERAEEGSSGREGAKEAKQSAIAAAQRRETRKYLLRLDRAEKRERAREQSSTRFELFNQLGVGSDIEGGHRSILNLRPPALELPPEQLVGQRQPGAIGDDPAFWKPIGDDELWAEVNKI